MENDGKKPTGLTIWLYLSAVWQRIIWIIAVVLAVALIAGLYSLTMPDQYEASAQVVLLPPFVTTNSSNQESRQLSSQSIGPLLKNAETAQRVLDQVRSIHGIISTKLLTAKGTAERRAATLAALPTSAWAAIPGFTKEEAALVGSLEPTEIEAVMACSTADLKSLSVGSILGGLEASSPIETRMATETVYSPVISVRATLSNGNLAKAVANQAARILADRYQELTMARAEQAASTLETQVGQQKQTLTGIDKQISEIDAAGNVNAFERELHWLDRAYGDLLLRNPSAPDAPELVSLRQRMSKLQTQRDVAKSKIDSLELVRMVHVAALQTLLDTQAEVKFTPPARLKKMVVLSPAGPYARHSSPQRMEIIGASAVVGLIFSLAGIFVLLLATVRQASDRAAVAER